MSEKQTWWPEGCSPQEIYKVPDSGNYFEPFEYRGSNHPEKTKYDAFGIMANTDFGDDCFDSYILSQYDD